jgi:enoyl-CoA hydratase/carnithine racemase
MSANAEPPTTDQGPGVELDIVDRVAVIRLNRPARLNAVGLDIMVGVAQSFIRVRDDDEIVAAVITGNGRDFCVGMDVKEWLARGEPGISAPNIEPLVDPYFPYRSELLNKPIVAAVNGNAFGAGFYLATNADLIVAGESARFEITEVIHGALVGWEYGILAGLPRNIALELALGGRLTARRAYDVGMVNDVVADEDVVDAAFARARRFVAMPPLGIHHNRRLLMKLAPTVPPSLAVEVAEVFDQLQHSDDLAESLHAFLERRAPRYRGT